MLYSTLKEEYLKNTSLDAAKSLAKSSRIKPYSELGTEGNFLKLPEDNDGRH